MINKETGGHGNKITKEDHWNYNITEIGQNTEKSPVDEVTFSHLNFIERPSANVDIDNTKTNRIT